MTDAIRDAREVMQLVRAGRFTLSNEKATQAEIETALTASGVRFVREHRLSAADVPDFFFPGSGLAVEVKLKGAGKMAIYRQLCRYARHDAVTALLLVTNQSMGLPSEIEGKPAFFASLGAGWL